MDESTREDLIDRYAEGPRVVRAVLQEILEDALDRRPASGEWTPREIVHHLADSEMTSAIRLRRLLAEDAAIEGNDEGKFARRLYYDPPIGPSLAALDAARATTTDILRCMTSEEWERIGSDGEAGAYALDIWLETYAAHCHDHADQIRRTARGGP